MKNLFSIISIISTIAVFAATEAPELSPAKKAAAEKVESFRSELNTRMEQDADTLKKRQIIPNNKKLEQYMEALEKQIEEKIKRDNPGKITGAQIAAFKKQQIKRKQKDIDKFKSGLESDTENLIARFKKSRTEKNQSKIEAYSKTLDAAISEHKDEETLPKFPAPVDPDKGKFIYQDFK